MPGVRAGARVFSPGLQNWSGTKICDPSMCRSPFRIWPFRVPGGSGPGRGPGPGRGARTPGGSRAFRVWGPELVPGQNLQMPGGSRAFWRRGGGGLAAGRVWGPPPYENHTLTGYAHLPDSPQSRRIIERFRSVVRIFTGNICAAARGCLETPGVGARRLFSRGGRPSS